MKPRSLPPDESVRQRRARRWRVVLVMAGFLLASTFFMPAVSGCNAVIIPAQECKPIFTEPSSHSWVDFGQTFVLYIAAYLWGLLIAVVAGVRLVRNRSAPRAMGCIPFLVVGLTAVLLIIFNVVDLLNMTISPLSTEFLGYALLLIICPAVMAYGVVALWRLGPRAHLALDSLGAVIACVWFSGWTLGGYYGVRLSLAASLLILLAVTGESATLTRRKWFSTIWRLATCRLRDADLPLAACPKCQYDLRGASEMRCPECGRPFSFEELGLAPEQVGFRQHLLVE